MTIDMLQARLHGVTRAASGALFGVLAFLAGVEASAQPVCAEVKIQILQTLNIERQGFIATMRIVNGLETPLTNIDVLINFKDRNGDGVVATTGTNTDALFFYREDLLTAIVGGVSGGGTIAPKTTGEAHWLIIPATGAGGMTAAGEIYSVGATLTYKEGAELRSVTVTPEVITVRPQPRLELDYFLPKDVYADDALTPEVVEPTEPFSLGVRISNSGAGPAQNVSIESAQPQIVENLQGLLIGFQIDGSYVQDQTAQNTLLMDFGAIEPGRAKVGRWIMSTTLSGQFSEFEAQYTHDDSLGGAVTSLLSRVTTHTLLKDVRVDLPGRDPVRDFLAFDRDTAHVRVYESEGLDTAVADLSAIASLTPALAPAPAGAYDLAFEPVLTATLVKVTDTTHGQFEVGRVERSDGKVLLPENTWKSRERIGTTSTWNHYLNVFDIGGTGRYRLYAANPVPPSSLAGLVYVDADGDGQRDPTEQGLAAVVVTIDGMTQSGDPVHRLSASDALGMFQFGELAAGSYSLIVGLAQGTINGVHRAGSVGGQVGVDRIDQIVIPVGASATGYMFAKQSANGPTQADLSITAIFAEAGIGAGPSRIATLTLQNDGPNAADASVVWQLTPNATIINASASLGEIDLAQSRWTVTSVQAAGGAKLFLEVRPDAAGSVVLASSVTGNALDPIASNNSTSAQFNVDETIPLVAQELDRTPRVLALVVCRIGGRVDVVCTNARATHLSALLAGIGVEHAVVTDTLTYREALRSRRYNVHWISGAIGLMSDQLTEELRNAVRRGDGVLLEGMHDHHEVRPVLGAVVGAYYQGALAGSVSSVTTLAGAFGAGTTLAPIVTAYPISPEPTASIEAQFDSGDVAVVSSNFGQGRSLVFAFELTDAATLSNATSWTEFVETALIWLTHEPTTDVLIRDFVPLATRIDNPLTAPVTVEISMALDSGLTLATTNLAMVPDAYVGEPRWLVTVPPGDSRLLEVGVRAQAETQALGVATTVTWKKPDGDAQLFSERVELSLLSFDERYDQVLGPLNALVLSDPSQVSQRDNAVASISDARSLKYSEPAVVVAKLIAAEQSLMALAVALADPQSPPQPVVVPVEEVSALVQEAGLRWQALSPRCGSAEFAGVVTDAANFWPFAQNERLEIRGGAPGKSDWEWAIGTDTTLQDPEHSVEIKSFDWVSRQSYNWQLIYQNTGEAELIVSEQGAPNLPPGGGIGIDPGLPGSFTANFAPGELPGMRSGNAVRLSVTLDGSEPDTPIRVTLDTVNGAPATAVLNAGVAPLRDGSTAVYFPDMQAGMALTGTIYLRFDGYAPPAGSNLDVQVHAGAIACRPELSP